MSDQNLTINSIETARMLGVSRIAVKQYVKQGLLTKYNGRYKFKEIQDFIINRNKKIY